MTSSPATGGALQALALNVLRAVDEGLPAGSAARELAVEALRRMGVDTAGWCKGLAVLEGGALRMRHAVELAGLVLDATAGERHEREVG